MCPLNVMQLVYPNQFYQFNKHQVSQIYTNTAWSCAVLYLVVLSFMEFLKHIPQQTFFHVLFFLTICPDLCLRGGGNLFKMIICCSVLLFFLFM